ncbi:MULTISPECIES: flagellar hook-length control protein FliK [unclassified Sphingomonas]|uniref:flagellar hook-length control protein FliK n=1 Tax=unclassified Sphingomonas TaxID=196159 RepID=UPI00269F8AA6
MIQLSLSLANASAIAPILTVSAVGTGDFARALVLAGAAAEEEPDPTAPTLPAISLPLIRQALAAPGNPPVSGRTVPDTALLDEALHDDAVVLQPPLSDRLEPSPLRRTDDVPLALPAVVPDRGVAPRQAIISLALADPAGSESVDTDPSAQLSTQRSDRHSRIVSVERIASARPADANAALALDLPAARVRIAEAGSDREAPAGDAPVAEQQPVVPNVLIGPPSVLVVTEMQVAPAPPERSALEPLIASPIASAVIPERVERPVEGRTELGDPVLRSATPAPKAAIAAIPSVAAERATALPPSPIDPEVGVPLENGPPVESRDSSGPISAVAVTEIRIPRPISQVIAAIAGQSTVAQAIPAPPPAPSGPLSPVPLASLTAPVHVPLLGGRLEQVSSAEPIAFNRVDSVIAKSAAPTPKSPASIVAVAAPLPEAPVIGVAVPALRAFAAAIAATAERPVRIGRDEAVVTAPITGAIASEPAALRADSTAPLPVPVDMRRQDWTRALIDRIDAVHDVANARDTRITLVPDALGKIEVALRQVGETIHVQFAADVATTRIMLAEAQPRLAELADARGLRLGDTIIAAAPDQTAAAASSSTASNAPTAASTSTSNGSGTSFGQSADHRRGAPQPSANPANGKSSTNSAQARADSEDRIA